MIKKHDLIFDIDWKGTKQLSNFKELKLIKIYLITKTREEIKERLIRRNQNSTREIEKRYNSYVEDIKHWSDYDYIIINDNLEQCFKQITNVINLHKNSFKFFQKY